VWSSKNEVPILAPNWRRFRIGPYLRGERDKRQYQRYFHFPNYIRGVKRQYLLQRLPRFFGNDVDNLRIPFDVDGVVVFENMVSLNEETYFHRIVSHVDLVRDALVSITRPAYLPMGSKTPHIAIHVRIGDFSLVSLQDLKDGVKNARIPIEWYCEMLLGIRARLKCDCPAMIYSDGSDEQLGMLLNLKQTFRAPRQPAITDLLSMADASLILSSGSGFSTWGAFLGQVPRICFPHQRHCRTRPEGDTCDLEPDCEFAEELSLQFLELAKERLGI